MEIDEHYEQLAIIRLTGARPSIAKPPGFLHSIGATVIFTADVDDRTYGVVVGYAEPEKVQKLLKSTHTWSELCSGYTCISLFHL
jgi:hypothetical protein